MDITSVKALSKLYTPATFKKVVKNRSALPVLRRLRKFYTPIYQETIGEAFEDIYSCMQQNYRIEYVYKNELLDQLLLKKYSLSETRVFNELKIGKSIADFVLINGEVRVFEIKTDLDKLDKLSKQLEDYKKVSDRVYVVCGDSQAQELKSKLENTSTGIIIFDSLGTLHEIKEAEVDRGNLDIKEIFKLLKKAEYLSLHLDTFGFIPTVPNTKIYSECLSSFINMDPTNFLEIVREKLKERSIKITSSDINQVPDSLKYISYSLNFDDQDLRVFNRIMKKKL